MKLYLYILLFLVPFQAFTQQKPMLISEEDKDYDVQTQKSKGSTYLNYSYKLDANGNVLEKIETYRSTKYSLLQSDIAINNKRDTYTYDALGNELSSVNESWTKTTNTWCCKLIHDYTYEGKNMMTHSFSKDIKEKTVPQFKEVFKYDAAGNRIEKLYQSYDTVLTKYVDVSKSIFTYNSKNQLLKAVTYYWKSNKWIEGYVTDFTYNANDSLELRTEKRNYLKALDNLSEKVTTEGWKTESVRKWFYNPHGIDIGNTISFPHPVTGELTVLETREYQEDANRNMIAYAEVIAGFDKENKLNPVSTNRWTLSYSADGTTINKTDISEYNYTHTSLGVVTSAHLYTLKYDGIVQKGFVDPYNKKYGK